MLEKPKSRARRINHKIGSLRQVNMRSKRDQAYGMTQDRISQTSRSVGNLESRKYFPTLKTCLIMRIENGLGGSNLKSRTLFSCLPRRGVGGGGRGGGGGGGAG